MLRLRAKADPNHRRSWHLFPVAGQYVLAAGIAFLPLPWVVLYSLHGLSIKPAQLDQIALSIMALCFAPASFRGLRTLLKVNPLFWMAYLTYALSLLLIALPQNLAGSGPLFKQLTYFAAVLAMAAMIVALPPERVARAFFYGSIAGIVLFIVVAEVSLHMRGDSYVWHLLLAVKSANVNDLVFGIYNKMFNALHSDGEDKFTSSLRNTVAAGVVVIFVLLNMVKPAVAQLGTLGRCVQLVGLWVSTFLLFCLLSRSALLAAGLAVACYAFLRALARNVSGTELLAVVLGCLIAATILFASDAVSHLLGERLFGDTGSYDSRLAQFAESLGLINRNFFLGRGLGTEVGGMEVHNLFLASWVEGGLLAFLLATLYYAVLFGSAAAYGFQISRRSLSWALPLSPEWAVALTALPLTRAWLGGRSGQFTLAEWTAVALFYGIFALNASILHRSRLIAARTFLRTAEVRSAAGTA